MATAAASPSVRVVVRTVWSPVIIRRRNTTVDRVVTVFDQLRTRLRGVSVGRPTPRASTGTRTGATALARLLVFVLLVLLVQSGHRGATEASCSDGDTGAETAARAVFALPGSRLASGVLNKTCDRGTRETCLGHVIIPLLVFVIRRRGTGAGTATARSAATFAFSSIVALFLFGMLPRQSDRASNRSGTKTETSKSLCAGSRRGRRRRPRAVFAVAMVAMVAMSVAVSAPILRLCSSPTLAPVSASGTALAAMTGYCVRRQRTDSTSTHVLANPRQCTGRFAPFLPRAMADQLSGSNANERTLGEMSPIVRIFIALVAAVVTASPVPFRVRSVRAVAAVDALVPLFASASSVVFSDVLSPNVVFVVAGNDIVTISVGAVDYLVLSVIMGR